MTDQNRPVAINMSGIPVAGVGGLGLVAVAVLITIVLPAAWWLVLFGAAGGCVVGITLVLMRRRRCSSGPATIRTCCLEPRRPRKAAQSLRLHAGGRTSNS
jgi:hypothetical protein